MTHHFQCLAPKWRLISLSPGNSDITSACLVAAYVWRTTGCSEIGLREQGEARSQAAKVKIAKLRRSAMKRDYRRNPRVRDVQRQLPRSGAGEATRVYLGQVRMLTFDIYRKVPKDLTQPTYTGAIISICCCLFILFLFLSELTGFITTEVVNELYVDDPDKDSGGKIDVSLNISLPNLHCELVGLDIQDEMGRHEVGHIDNSMKIPLNNGAGCRFEGQFSINKVPGNFHVSTHSATAQPQNPDMTHVIHKLSFGDTLQVSRAQ
ncbi:hypothetical protein HPG69_016801 [Diceros bicornis minor]|uniref:Endoplasmic reticulum-Golgi intermediate compartment protein n=1 Tax=Diceros bicornis minor TaxID=77932 RepID=A0A7J7ECQ0_DICBM|nr:hypothetical protein HPG69_016801 [Diceros bicornis minor]